MTRLGAAGSTVRATGSPSPAGGHTAGFSTTWLASTWHAVSAALGVLAGVAPHVLHHLGILAGAFFVAGAVGSLLFGAVGLLLTVPLLLRLFHRFGTWKAPALALAVFAVMFALSTFVVGPALTGGTDGPDRLPSTPMPTPTSSTNPDHDAHHP